MKNFGVFWFNLRDIKLNVRAGVLFQKMAEYHYPFRLVISNMKKKEKGHLKTSKQYKSTCPVVANG